MASFKGLAWNCGGIKDSTVSRKKALYFEKEYKNDFVELLRYQNTHHIIHSTVAENETHSWIIGLIKKDYDIIEQNELIQGRILNIKIENKNDKIKRNIAAVYLDTNPGGDLPSQLTGMCQGHPCLDNIP